MLKKLMFLFCFIMTSCFAEYKYELSICTVFRNEAPYLKEWIEFHRLLGVQHFYLCNHVSTDNYQAVLEPYIRAGIVELKEFPDEHPDLGIAYFCDVVQCGYFNETLEKARGVSKWVAFIDSDEFLYPLEKDSLVEFLKDYEEFGGVCANWQLFGTSYVAKLNPKKLLIEQLIRCASNEGEYVQNTHIKSIVQPERADHFPNPHWCYYRNGYSQVNTDKVPFSGPFSPYIQVNKLRLNHYWTKDEDYLWHYKIPRNLSFGRPLEYVLTINDESNRTTDFSIQRFVPALRKRVGLD